MECESMGFVMKLVLIFRSFWSVFWYFIAYILTIIYWTLRSNTLSHI